MRPRAVILAGPNGAGKTTFAYEFLTHEGRCPTFINADLIASGLAPFDPQRVSAKAMRLMMDAVAEHVAIGADFAVETTLAGRSYQRHIRSWQQRGYHVHINFLSLSSVDLALRRVAQRVAQGGHHIPDAVVRRRFERGRMLFEVMYRELADSWALYDANTLPPALIRQKGSPL